MSKTSDQNKKDRDAAYCITPEFRVSYPHVFQPYKQQDDPDGPGKYSVTMLFPKGTNLDALKKAAHAALVKKWGADPKKWPRNLKRPFRDGGEKVGTDGYEEGMIFIAAGSKTRPGVIDQRKAPIVEADNSFYAGCFARASLQAFTYDKAGNKGVNFALQNIQKTRDGEPFSGRRKADEEFDEIDDGGTSDSPQDYDYQGEDEGDFLQE